MDVLERFRARVVEHARWLCTNCEAVCFADELGAKLRAPAPHDPRNYRTPYGFVKVNPLAPRCKHCPRGANPIPQPESIHALEPSLSVFSRPRHDDVPYLAPLKLAVPLFPTVLRVCNPTRMRYIRLRHWGKQLSVGVVRVTQMFSEWQRVYLSPLERSLVERNAATLAECSIPDAARTVTPPVGVPLGRAADVISILAQVLQLIPGVPEE